MIYKKSLLNRLTKKQLILYITSLKGVIIRQQLSKDETIGKLRSARCALIRIRDKARRGELYGIKQIASREISYRPITIRDMKGDYEVDYGKNN